MIEVNALASDHKEASETSETECNSLKCSTLWKVILNGFRIENVGLCFSKDILFHYSYGHANSDNVFTDSS